MNQVFLFLPIMIFIKKRIQITNNIIAWEDVIILIQSNIIEPEKLNPKTQKLGKIIKGKSNIFGLEKLQIFTE